MPEVPAGLEFVKQRLRRRNIVKLAREYRSKCMSAAEAVKAVRSGDRVWIQPSCGTPKPLIDALVARGAGTHRRGTRPHEDPWANAAYTRPEYEGHFRHRGLFLGDNVREAVAAGRADYTPIFLSEIEGLFETGALAAGCRADAGVAAGCARIRQPEHDRGLHHDRGSLRQDRDRRGERARSADAWRHVHSRQPDLRVR